MHPRTLVCAASAVALTITSSCSKHHDTSGHAAPAASGSTAPASAVRTVKGDGITITEAADGQVILKTTSRWNDPLDATYQDCTYYLKAVPVLADQVSAERAKLLGQICVGKP